MTKINSTLIDIASLLFSIVILGIVAAWTLNGDFMHSLLTGNGSMTWQLIRSSGMTAYILFTLSTVWGLALSSKIVKNWSPGSLSMLLHVSLSWLGVIFAVFHALILLFDKFVTYRISEILIPFTGPYRPLAVGLGTLAFWMMLMVAGSFSIKKWLGHRRWKLLHYTSYVGFFMITAHAFFAGTDAGKMGFQVLLGLALVTVLGLTVYRISGDGSNQRSLPARERMSRAKID